MPQSQPHHSRSYGAPSTVRRRGDKENAGALPSKTPSRNALKQVAGPSTGRMLGKATIDRNILAPKSDAPPPNDDIKPKRLFANVQPPASTTRPVKPRSVKTPAHAKTPAPYRDVEPEPQPTPLPSAQRTRRRSRNSLVRTPEHHWDQELSLDSIAEVELEPAPTPTVESDYELEYAPSPVKEMSYVPEWADSIPDPIETMTKLGNMRPMLFTTAPSPPKAIQPVPMPTLELCDDDEIEEPMLRKVKPAAVAPKPKVAPAAKPVSRTPGIRGQNGAARSGAAVARPAARAPTTTRPAVTKPASSLATRPAVSKPASGSSAARPLVTKAALARSGVAAKPATAIRSAPLGAARSVATSRPATATSRTASVPLKSGVRGVLSKTETRPTASRPAPASTVRKPATAPLTSKPSVRPGVKPVTATRPALASKPVARTAASAPAKKPAPAATPSSPVPEFADMEMNFGVLDLDFDELEPKVQTPPAVDLGSELIDLSLPAAEPEQAFKPEEAVPVPSDVAQPIASPDIGKPATVEAVTAQPAVQETVEAVADQPVVAQLSEIQAPDEVAEFAEPVAVEEPAAVDEPVAVEEPVTTEQSVGQAMEFVAQPEESVAQPEESAVQPEESVAQPEESIAQPEEQLVTGRVTTHTLVSDDFEAVDPALAPAIPSSNLAFDTIPEEMEQELDLDMSALDISEDMSIESI